MQFTADVSALFPGLHIAEGLVRSVRMRPDSSGIAALRESVTREVRLRYTLETVRDDPLFRAYRDFFWKIGVDPTKTRPASEALVRRILAGRDLPQINPVVDVYNLASVQSGIPIAAFDADMLKGPLSMRLAREGERFAGIGMEKPILLSKNQVVLDDGESIVAVYPYRDSDATKVTEKTENVWIVSCGVPGIKREMVARAYRICTGYLSEYCGGVASEPGLFPGNPEE